MPYRIEERDGKYCVVKETDGETIHCHDTREQAEAQMRALYANAGEKAQKATLYVPFSKVDHEQRMVWGVATDETRDAENDVVDYEATKRATAEWAKWRNIREMHGPSAVGVAEEIILDDATKSLRIGAKIVDDKAWAKVKAGVYKGFSIGGKVLRTMMQKAGEGDQWVRRVVDYALTEISLVDRPANPRAVFTLVKRTEVGGAQKMYKKKAALLRKRLAWLRTLNTAAQSLQARTALSKAGGGRLAIAVEATDKAVAQTLAVLSALRRLAKMEEDEEVQQAVEAAQEAVETAQEVLDQATVAADEARAELEAKEEPTEEEQAAVEAIEGSIVEAQETLDAVSELLDETQETLDAPEEQTEPEAQSDQAGLTVEQVREIVMALLQELGLLPSGEVTMAAQVSELRKRLETAASGEELKKLGGDLSKVIGDLAKVAAAVEALEERLDLVQKMASGQGPVLREIAPWEVSGQSEAALKMMLSDDSLDPRVREAVGQRLAEMQIKAAQRQALVVGR